MRQNSFFAIFDARGLLGVKKPLPEIMFMTSDRAQLTDSKPPCLGENLHSFHYFFLTRSGKKESALLKTKKRQEMLLKQGVSLSFLI